MKQKHLESALSSVTREFPNPQVNLEQYATSFHLAASVTLMALRHGDVGPGRTVLDLGCGTGMLTLGAALVESDLVLGVDIDEEALAVAQSNVEELELQHVVQLIQAQVPFQPDADLSSSLATALQQPSSTNKKNTAGKRQNFRGGRSNRGRRPPAQRGGGRRRERDDGTDDRSHGGKNDDDDDDDCHTTSISQTPLENKDRSNESNTNSQLPLRDKCVDTVLTNPPFGTKQNAGIDVQFLKEATRLARCTVYSFHKTSTRAFLLRTIEQWGFQPQVVAEMKFDLPNVYKFHRQGEVNIEVDLLRITIGQQLERKLEVVPSMDEAGYESLYSDGANDDYSSDDD